jgi:hypothetical protein
MTASLETGGAKSLSFWREEPQRGILEGELNVFARFLIDFSIHGCPDTIENPVRGRVHAATVAGISS